MSAAGLYFLLRGEAIENSTLNRHIEAEVRKIVGGDYVIDLGRTTVGFDRDGLLSVAGTDVQILQANDRRPVSRLGRIVVGIKPWSVVTGTPRVDAVIVEDSILDGRVLAGLVAGAAPQAGMDETLRLFGQRLRGVRDQFADKHFRLLQFRDVHVNGLDLGRREPGSIFVSELELRLRRGDDLSLAAKLSTGHSKIEIDSSFITRDGGSSELSLDLAGINLRDWTWELDSERGPVGTRLVVDAAARFGFNADGTPLEPTIRLTGAGERLRIGRKGRTDIRELQLNLRLMPQRNQIEIDPSILVAGGFHAQIVGGMRPADDALGFAGPLRFELVADPVRGTPTVLGERAVVAGMKFAGHYLPEESRINFDEVLAIAGRDRIMGSASIVFIGETPSIAAAARSRRFPVYAAKQLWPFWIAPPARRWAFANLVGGELTDISLSAGIPSGVIGRIHRGAKMKADEFELTARFDDVRVDTFGDLPAIRDASGRFSLRGMTFTARLAEGVAYDGSGNRIAIPDGRFLVTDFAERPAPASADVTLEGDAISLARLMQARPLTVFDRIGYDPERISGKAHADIVTRFPLKRDLDLAEVEWNAIVEVEDAASSEKLFGRQISDADLVIEADRTSARINGQAVVDGTRTQLSLVEPLGGSDVQRERKVAATLDADALSRMGISLGKVIDGPLDVRMVEAEDGTRQVIDLTQAEIELPWIGWRKGAGIPAEASFAMRSENGITNIDDFYIEGPSFSAAGEMEVDKGGLLSADFPNVALNEGDAFSMELSRRGKTYEITVSGARMDARGLINKLFHGGGIGDEQGDANLTVTANLGSVRGFGGRVVRNVSMSYGTKAGWFDSLSVRGAFSDTSYVSVLATTVDRRTTFQIDSSDAGSALAMVDVYRRLEGGELRARLVRDAGGPFVGPVVATNFEVVDEPRLKSLVGDPFRVHRDRADGFAEVKRQLDKVNTNRVRFVEARATIDKGAGYFRVQDAALNAVQIGLTFDGLLFDENDYMNLKGTFLPAMGINRAIGMIPFVNLLGNGRDTGLMGVTFRLSGPRRNPTLEINPISAIAPGEFRRVFEFQQ